MRILILSAAGVLAATAIPAAAEAQYYHGYYPYISDIRNVGEAEREYRRELVDAQRECDEELREADSRREWIEAQRECRREFAEIEREYWKELRGARRDWREDRRDESDDDEYD